MTAELPPLDFADNPMIDDVYQQPDCTNWRGSTTDFIETDKRHEPLAILVFYRTWDSYLLMAQWDHCADEGKISPYYGDRSGSLTLSWKHAFAKHKSLIGLEKQVHYLGTARDAYQNGAVNMFFLVDIPVAYNQIAEDFGHRNLKLYEDHCYSQATVALMNSWLARRVINISDSLIVGFYFLTKYFVLKDHQN
ncbi:MAG: hypothetical protein IH840_02725 [Candidatus Heimdallarchaeota archaeon]|nr:hypothetical protein [Candidatus Heimdallarchaeota archaeon]